MARRFLQVLVEVPPGVYVDEAKEYIRDELRAAGGQRRPEDPLFHGMEVLEVRSVRPMEGKL